MLVLRIHTDGRLVLTELTGSQISLEGIVVTIVTCHLQWLYIEHFLFTVLIDADVHLLQSDSIVETLLVDDVLNVVRTTCLATRCREIPLAADYVDGIPTLGNGFLPLSDILGQTIVVGAIWAIEFLITLIQPLEMPFLSLS